jgi:acyl dehydratase
MSLSTEAVGRTFPAVSYQVGREKIREYANAVGETNPIHHDVEAARAAGYPDLVAPPMFAVVYAAPSVAQALIHPDVGLDFSMMVHGSQEFRWGPVVIAGEEISTTTTVKEIAERGGMGFYVFESVSENERAEVVCTAIWTNIVRGTS